MRPESPMALAGDQKAAYQREYMRRRRAGQPPPPKPSQPSDRWLHQVERWAKDNPPSTRATQLERLQ